MTRESLRIRAAHAGDAEAIADVYLASRKQLVSFAPIAHPDADVRQWIADVLVPGGVVVAILDGAVVGMCATSKEQGVSWIDQLYVDPTHVGRGIGTALLVHALRQLAPPIRLYTFQANDGARRFYERWGFVPVAFGDGSDNEEGVPDVLYERAAPLNEDLGPGARLDGR